MKRIYKNLIMLKNKLAFIILNFYNKLKKKFKNKMKNMILLKQWEEIEINILSIWIGMRILL